MYDASLITGQAKLTGGLASAVVSLFGRPDGTNEGGSPDVERRYGVTLASPLMASPPVFTVVIQFRLLFAAGETYAS